MAVLFVSLGLAAASHAQTARPSISISPTLSVEPASQVAVAIRVGPAGSVPKGSFVRIRGLPPTVALSEGYSIAPGSWAVPLTALPSLKITMPAAATGRSEISVTLVGVDGALLAEARSILVVTASRRQTEEHPQDTTVPPASILRAGTPPPAAPEPTARVPSNIPPEPKPGISAEQHERALRMLKRGNEHLAEGGIAQARLLFERAAEAGLAEGAMALGATYDPAELERLGVRGLQPDPTSALRWYGKAREMGAPDAQQRLHRLGAK